VTVTDDGWTLHAGNPMPEGWEPDGWVPWWHGEVTGKAMSAPARIRPTAPDRYDPARCPDCGEKIEWRSQARSPLENEWVPYCPACGFGGPTTPAPGGVEGAKRILDAQKAKRDRQAAMEAPAPGDNQPTWTIDDARRAYLAGDREALEQALGIPVLDDTGNVIPTPNLFAELAVERAHADTEYRHAVRAEAERDAAVRDAQHLPAALGIIWRYQNDWALWGDVGDQRWEHENCRDEPLTDAERAVLALAETRPQ
jgi:predicted RNA-binding Zn-ribbon protein involved in translation (DUF1610 family)